MQDAIKQTIEVLELKIGELQSAVKTLKAEPLMGQTVTPPSAKPVTHRHHNGKDEVGKTKYNVSKGQLIRAMSGKGELSILEIATSLSSNEKGVRFTAKAIAYTLDKYQTFTQVGADKWIINNDE